MASIEIRKDRNGQFRFNVKGRNGEIIATSESYRDKAKARATIRSMQTALAKAKVIDLSVDASGGGSKTGAGKAGGGKSAAAKGASKGKAAKIGKTAKAGGKSSEKRTGKPAKKSAGKGTSARGSATAKPKTTKPGNSSSPKKSPPPARPARPAASAGDRGRDANASEMSEAPRSFNPTRIAAASPAPVIDTDDVRDTELNDIDVIPGREGADIVRPSELGDGEHVSSDLESDDIEDDDGEID